MDCEFVAVSGVRVLLVCWKVRVRLFNVVRYSQPDLQAISARRSLQLRR